MRRAMIIAAIVAIDLAAYAGLLLAPARKSPARAAPVSALQALKVEPVKLYRDAGHSEAGARGLIIYFSDAAGWSAEADATAKALAARGFAVAAVDSRAFLSALDRTPDACVHPVQPLVALARQAEGALGWTHPRPPILAGHGLGGTLAYATLAQAVPGIFVAGISTGFADILPGTKRWCSLNGYREARVEQPAPGWRPGPSTALTTPWRLIYTGSAAGCAAAQPILVASPGARALTADDEVQGVLAALRPILPPARDLPQTSPAA